MDGVGVSKSNLLIDGVGVSKRNLLMDGVGVSKRHNMAYFMNSLLL